MMSIGTAACTGDCHPSLWPLTSFENQTEVVGGHLDSLGQYESGASGNV